MNLINYFQQQQWLWWPVVFFSIYSWGGDRPNSLILWLLVGLLYQSHFTDVWICSIGEMAIDKGKQSKYLQRNLPQATMSTTNPTWTAWGSNPGLHDEKLVTSCLSCGMVHTMQCLCSYHFIFPIHENIFSVSSYILFSEALVTGGIKWKMHEGGFPFPDNLSA